MKNSAQVASQVAKRLKTGDGKLDLFDMWLQNMFTFLFNTFAELTKWSAYVSNVFSLVLTNKLLQ